MEELCCENCEGQDIGEVDGIITCKDCGTKKYSEFIKKKLEIDEEIRLKEIRRLTSPLIRPIFRLPKDIEGNPAKKDPFTRKFTIEPKAGILSDDEILKYAGDSRAASRIRLKRGHGSTSDKTKVNNTELFGVWFMGMFSSFMGMFSSIVLIFTLGVPILFTLYVLHWKDYKDKTHESKKEVKYSNDSNTTYNNEKNDIEVCDEFKKYKEDVNDLKSQYKIKEEIAKKLIKKYFPPPQLTYDSFMLRINEVGRIFSKQADQLYNIINITEEYSPKISEELKSRINILESIEDKMNELVVELVTNSSKETNSKKVKEALTEMQNVIDSVKKYDY